MPAFPTAGVDGGESAGPRTQQPPGERDHPFQAPARILAELDTYRAGAEPHQRRRQLRHEAAAEPVEVQGPADDAERGEMTLSPDAVTGRRGERDDPGPRPVRPGDGPAGAARILAAGGC